MSANRQTLSALRSELRRRGSPKKAAASAWFFKTGKGEYAHGDRFIGVTVPEQRAIAKRYRHLSLPDIQKLLRSPWHEERLTALFLLVDAFKRGDAKQRERIHRMYLRHTRYINNWDLVDSSAEYIVGAFLDGSLKRLAILGKLAKSPVLWERRIAMVATYHFIKRGSSREACTVAKILMRDPHDLIHKAMGWMLREVGARCSRAEEERFLQRYAATMPRTALRYALEHFPRKKRAYYMELRA